MQSGFLRRTGILTDGSSQRLLLFLVGTVTFWRGQVQTEVARARDLERGVRDREAPHGLP
ncbi:MAG: hypothetical protein ABEH59_13950 [Halobacteriales archaeon]